ncbi:MAG TPA: ferric iron reductase [Alphaproteobacteria bacterium]|nr:ferric iron reductase [Alphaproteobacteria bacterium]
MGFDQKQFLVLLQTAVDGNNHDQFYGFWNEYENEIENYFNASRNETTETFLDLLQDYLLKTLPSDNLADIYIDYSNPSLLRRLHFICGCWSLLVANNRLIFMNKHANYNWQAWIGHERPINEAYRWQIKASLDHTFGIGGYDQKIFYFTRAAEAAEAGTSSDCIALGRAMRAQALKFEGDKLIRFKSEHPKIRLGRAREIFGRAKQLVEGRRQGEILGFYEKLCEMRVHELNLDSESALRAHRDAVQFALKLPESNYLFTPPNPWASIGDFENERLFIIALRVLFESKSEGIDEAIKLIRAILSDCPDGVRHSHLQVRLLFLEGLQATLAHKSLARLKTNVIKFRRMLDKSVVRRDDIDLLTLLTSIHQKSDVVAVLEQALTLFPFDSQGRGEVSLERAILYGAPLWLRRLYEQKADAERSIFFTWFTRIIVDYLWSIYEKKNTVVGRALFPRPKLWRASLSELESHLSLIIPALHWDGGAQEDALWQLLSDVGRFARLNGPIAEDDLQTAVLASETQLFPLCVKFEKASNSPNKLFMHRLDGRGIQYEYDTKNVDPRPIAVSGQQAYLKSRYRTYLQQPWGQGRKPLYLYSAPNYPDFKIACLIVEGPSDKIFFEGILDRIEPGWQCLRSGEKPDQSLIEIVVCDGANNVERVYKQVRSTNRFHIHAPSADGSHERIVVVVDVDHENILCKGDLAMCNHRFTLVPDLERANIKALKTSIAHVTGRTLTPNEVRFLDDSPLMASQEFNYRVNQLFSLDLKSVTSRNGHSPFSAALARTFPILDLEPAGKLVTSIIYRLLQLALGTMSS